MKIINGLAAVLACIGVLLSGCASEAPRSRGAGSPIAAESMDRSSTQDSAPGFKPDRMLVWKVRLTLTVGNPSQVHDCCVHRQNAEDGYSIWQDEFGKLVVHAARSRRREAI